MSKNVFYDELEKSLQEKEVIAVYMDPEYPESFLVCTVTSLFSDSAIFSCINKDGELNGFQASRLDEIYRIERGTRYIKKMESLAGNKGDEVHFEEVEDGFRTLLRYALGQKRLVSVRLYDDDAYDMTRYIRSIEGEKVVLENIDQYGLEDGISIFLLSDTTEINCDSIYEQKLYELIR